MKTRIAMWACSGFLAAGFWGLYFANADKSKPIGPLVDALARLTVPKSSRMFIRPLASIRFSG